MNRRRCSGTVGPPIWFAFVSILLCVSFSALDPAIATQARIEELAQDVEFGTPEIRDEALKELARTDTVESSEVLGRFMMSLINEDRDAEVVKLILDELLNTPHTEYCPELVEPICNLVMVYNPPGRDPWPRERPYAEHSRPRWFPEEWRIVELIIHMQGSDADELIVSLATESYAFLGRGRTYSGMRDNISGDHRGYFTAKIIEAIVRICDEERADQLVLGIASGFYSYRDKHPMDAAVYYLGEHQVEGGREVLESILKDHDTLDMRKVPAWGNRSPWALLLSENGHWLTNTDYAYVWPLGEKKTQSIIDHQYDVFGAMIPILWALVEYESPIVRQYASMFKNADHAGDQDLSLILCAVGDMTYRSTVHDVLRSKRVDERSLAAKCMLTGGNLNDKDLAILGYVARQDPDPALRQYVIEGLERSRGPAIER